MKAINIKRNEMKNINVIRYVNQGVFLLLDVEFSRRKLFIHFFFSRIPSFTVLCLEEAIFLTVLWTLIAIKPYETI